MRSGVRAASPVGLFLVEDEGMVSQVRQAVRAVTMAGAP